MKRLRVAYNNAYQIMHYIPRNVRVRPHQVNHYVRAFDTLFIKYLHELIRRCESSSNVFIRSVQRSDAFRKSSFFLHYLTLLYDDDHLQFAGALSCCLIFFSIAYS